MENVVVRYDPTNAFFKSVVGAVCEDEAFTVRLQLDVVVAPAKVFLHVDKDGGESQETQMTLEKCDEKNEFYVAKVKFAHGLYFYYFRMEGVTYEHFIGIGADKKASLYYDAVRPWQLSVMRKKRFSRPEWLNKGVAYQIFPDRFFGIGKQNEREGKVLRKWGEQPNYKPDADGEYRCNDFFGGNLKGIVKKLPYLKSLGVKVIYLNPIFSSPSNHKYNTDDYEKIDADFGTEQDFDDLVAATKKAGISLILDGVFNHVGDTSKYFNRTKKYGDGGAYNDKKSPYRKWFTFRENGVYDSWWGIPSLPRINASCKDAQRYFCGANGIVPNWLKRGASGWRLDVVDEVADAMLDGIVRSAKKQREDCAVIGEVWEDASNKVSYGVRRHYFDGTQLDSVMNYPLKDGILHFAATGETDLLASVAFDEVNNYPLHVRNDLMNILGTHDTVRALTALAGEITKSTEKSVAAAYRLTDEQYAACVEKLKAAALLQYTFFGFPCVYYGDEVGMEGGDDPFCRACYPWGKENKDLLDYYRRLGELRKNVVFAEGDFVQLCAKDGVYAFSRQYANEKAVVAVNRSEEATALDLDGEYVDFFTSRVYRGTVEVQPRARLALLRKN